MSLKSKLTVQRLLPVVNPFGNVKMTVRVLVVVVAAVNYFKRKAKEDSVFYSSLPQVARHKVRGIRRTWKQLKGFVWTLLHFGPTLGIFLLIQLDQLYHNWHRMDLVATMSLLVLLLVVRLGLDDISADRASSCYSRSVGFVLAFFFLSIIHAQG